jgi:competence protein ComEA
MKTDRLRYILLGVGILAGVIFLVIRLIPPAAPLPVIVSNALSATPELPPAPNGPPTAPKRTRHQPIIASAGSSDDGSSITVDVEGAVKHPNVYQVAPGARALQALGKAGGITDDADPASVNRAEKLTDGQEIIVLTKEQTAAHSRRSSHARRSGRRTKSGKSTVKITSGTININTASLDELEQIPGVGKITAQRIVDERQQIGGFRNSSDLMEIDGMTPSKFEKMRPFISIF